MNPTERPRILIYAINGKGMGHLNRTLVLADAVRAYQPELEILFATVSPLFSLIHNAGFPVLKIPDRNHALGFHLGREGRAAHSQAIFEAIFANYRPSIFVVDVTINEQLFRLASDSGARVALMLRKQRVSALAEAARNPATDLVSYFLVPHPTEEFPLEEIPPAWRSRVRRLGPIVRTLQMDQVASVKSKYATSAQPLVLVTVGGGGNKHAEETLAAAERAAAASIGEIQWVIGYGPYYPHEIPPNQANVKRVRFEPNLLELATAADVMVCNAGYNTIREVEVAGTPAVVIPLDWSYADDQKERADMLVRGGRAVLGKATGTELLRQVRELIEAGSSMRRPPLIGEPSSELGQRFIHSLR